MGISLPVTVLRFSVRVHYILLLNETALCWREVSRDEDERHSYLDTRGFIPKKIQWLHTSQARGPLVNKWREALVQAIY